MDVGMTQVKFNECVKKAEKRIETNGKRYCTYKEHCAVYMHILDSIQWDLVDITKGFENRLDKYTREHAMHCIALKLARIVTSPQYEDSYIDVFGYLFLLHEALPKVQIEFQKIYGIPNAHVINDFLLFVNAYFKELYTKEANAIYEEARALVYARQEKE